MIDDALIRTEVASALYHELGRQNVSVWPNEETETSGIDCDALALVAIKAYLGIQRRLVTAKLAGAAAGADATLAEIIDLPTMARLKKELNTENEENL